MSAQIVFLTLFLGVVAGPHPISMQVSGPIKTVRMMLGSHEVAVLRQPPWRATVDMGRELTPRELTAVGFDADGREIARATQILNLPRPIAEFDIALEHAGGEAPNGLTLRWRHLMGLSPTKATARLDGRRLTLDRKLHARLPKLDLEMPHVVTAELQFEDGFVARRELVIESFLSDSVGTQLTPIAVRETSAQHPPSWDGCLVASSGKAVRTAAVENPRALVIVVRDPNARDAFDAARRGNDLLSLDKDTFQRMLWPVGMRFASGDNPTSFLFTPSGDSDATKVKLLRFLTMRGPVTLDEEERYFADAVAAAGIGAATGTQRRAVILVLSRKEDASGHKPDAVRRYLAALGVPLFVWSPTGAPSPAWGEVDDVSSPEKLAAAVERVRRALAEERIAWVDVDPLTALRLKAKERCGIETVAREEP